MKWLELPSPFPEIRTVLGGWQGEFSYVITFNSESGCWIASTRKINSRRPLVRLGVFGTREQCEVVCEQHQQRARQ